ncbi:MAG: 50S ribosomal protein L3 [Anaerolineae bacterium]|nr:50S ribosomal protein L3 [Anaerolineales bacterium]MCQ3973176.1 50S ribosomal protein L3 [Anaerolineae bacterium]
MTQILGKKVGMTQIVDEKGIIIPVTIIEAGPCYVTQKKTVENDGYSAVQLGFGDLRQKSLNKPKAGHLKKSGSPAVKYLREFRVSNPDEYQEGQKIDASIFAAGDVVDVIGTSKGKGFAGGVKRHGFSGGPKTHGQSDRWRAPGSIGAGTTPGRVWKGTRMAGRMGNDRVTVQNLKIALVDAEKNVIAVRGAVPGAKNGLVIVRKAVKG